MLFGWRGNKVANFLGVNPIMKNITFVVILAVFSLYNITIIAYICSNSNSGTIMNVMFLFYKIFQTDFRTSNLGLAHFALLNITTSDI